MKMSGVLIVPSFLLAVSGRHLDLNDHMEYPYNMISSILKPKVTSLQYIIATTDMMISTLCLLVFLVSSSMYAIEGIVIYLFVVFCHDVVRFSLIFGLCLFLFEYFQLYFFLQYLKY